MINSGNIAVILISEAGLDIALKLKKELPHVTVYSKSKYEGCEKAESYKELLAGRFADFDAFIFIGALGICVRYISACVNDKHTDPAVVNIDSTGRFAVSVLSGHIGGGNELAMRAAAVIGAQPVITTQSDNTGLWALDTMANRFGWQTSATPAQMNRFISAFVGKRPVALLLEVKDKGTEELERTCPPHVTIYYDYESIEQEYYDLIIAVTYKEYDTTVPMLTFVPKVLVVGAGCRRDCEPADSADSIKNVMRQNGLSPEAVRCVATIELKKDEKFMQSLSQELACGALEIYHAQELAEIDVPNPSDKVFEVTGVYGVAESCAIKASGGGRLLMEKQKEDAIDGNSYTFAVSLDTGADRSRGHVEIVGAGPGDPELISVRGKHFLQRADLVLYAGSLVPAELTYYAKPGATVRSSAYMTLEEQFKLMKSFYDKGLLVVRLHTGDPCIYGAIAEQMAFFDKYGMHYHITPGISSFQAAAAALRSQFTIPEKVQTIILTRGEGRTPMPEKEKLHLLARSQSTMCIYLSAAIAEQVQDELLQAYPPETPVAACYKLTWKEEKIYRGQLKDLARIVKDNNLTLTTLLVVGDAIDHREGVSRLYSDDFKHMFRK